MEKRRQNHSCEQCRKSKKACDGFLVNSSQNSLTNAATVLSAALNSRSGECDPLQFCVLYPAS
jgi:hypothetical protein